MSTTSIRLQHIAQDELTKIIDRGGNEAHEVGTSVVARVDVIDAVDEAEQAAEDLSRLAKDLELVVLGTEGDVGETQAIGKEHLVVGNERAHAQLAALGAAAGDDQHAGLEVGRAGHVDDGGDRGVELGRDGARLQQGQQLGSVREVAAMHEEAIGRCELEWRQATMQRSMVVEQRHGTIAGVVWLVSCLRRR